MYDLLQYDLLTLTILSFFFFNDPATTEIYTLSLHDALPISFLLKESPVFFVVKLWIHLAHVQKIPLGLRVGVDERFQPTNWNFAIGWVQRMDERSRQIHEGQTPDFFAVSRQVGWQCIQFHGQPHLDSALVGVPDDFVQQVLRDLKSLVRGFDILHFRRRKSAKFKAFFANRNIVGGSRAKSTVSPRHEPALLRGNVAEHRSLALVTVFQPRFVREDRKSVV